MFNINTAQTSVPARLETIQIKQPHRHVHQSNNGLSSVREGRLLAKPIPDCQLRKQLTSALQDYFEVNPIIGVRKGHNSARKLVSDFVIRCRRYNKSQIKAKALRNYRQGETLNAISIRYGVSIAAVSLWARAAGLKKRPQGCRKKQWPDDTTLQIVEEVRAVKDGKPTLAEIARRWRMSRANVHRIFHTWKNWKPFMRFQMGDKVRFKRRDYEVIESGMFEGKVRNLKTNEARTIPWRENDHIAVKL